MIGKKEKFLDFLVGAIVTSVLALGMCWLMDNYAPIICLAIIATLFFGSVSCVCILAARRLVRELIQFGRDLRTC